jgi:hypothetical protein
MKPPMWAKLSTCGRIPTAKLMAMMTTSVSRAAIYKNESCKLFESSFFLKKNKIEATAPQAISKECLGLMVLVPGISSRKASISATIY